MTHCCVIWHGPSSTESSYDHTSVLRKILSSLEREPIFSIWGSPNDVLDELNYFYKQESADITKKECVSLGSFFIGTVPEDCLKYKGHCLSFLSTKCDEMAWRIYLNGDACNIYSSDFDFAKCHDIISEYLIKYMSAWDWWCLMENPDGYIDSFSFCIMEGSSFETSGLCTWIASKKHDAIEKIREICMYFKIPIINRPSRLENEMELGVYFSELSKELGVPNRSAGE